MASLLYTAHVPERENLPAVPAVPAIIALHGWGAGAHDLLGLAPSLHDGKVLMLCPQGPVELNVGGGMKGYGWFPLVPGQPVDPAVFEASANRLRDFLDEVTPKYSIDPRRTVVAGFSQGGVMAYELALRDPKRFAGLAALSSWFPEPLVESLPKLPEHEGFPVLVMHGTQDTMLPVEQARASREALRPFGVSITYREFDMAHEIRPDALRVLLRWLDERILQRVP
ncbi:MAG TPA: alpha/beta hydrolase-fold protein [Thermoanaerobaculia bacterium]|jgi:phospholipase/carboxylesterase|nr:alpha/beta hydrolase-fold protein [Thermoanaerobaculia bacterium]